jgi:hypothetical protein
MKHVLDLAAILEAATGVALLVVPSLVGLWSLGAELTGVAAPVARILGIALIALGLACWPARPLVGMLTYSGAVMLYLISYSGRVSDEQMDKALLTEKFQSLAHRLARNLNHAL